jgi:hypothetical protein
MKSYILFFLFLLVVTIGILFGRPLAEGFANIPTSTQSSFLPQDVPGATTSDPRVVKKETKDILNAKDTIEFFQAVADPEEADEQTQELLLQAPVVLRQLEAFLENPEEHPLPEQFQTMVETFQKKGLANSQKGPSEPFAPRRNNQATIEESEKELIEGFATEHPLQDAIKRFKEVYESTDLAKVPEHERTKLKALYDGIDSYNALLQTHVSPNDKYFASRLTMITSQFQEATSILLPYQEMSLTTVGQTAGALTLADLKSLLKNIEMETIKLTNLRSTSPTMVARINQLTQLSAAVRTYTRKVESKEMDIKDVPIRGEDAKTFLATLSTSDVVPPLIKPTGTTPPALVRESGSAPVSSPLPGNTVAAAMPTQQLFEALQQLKWSMEIKVDYDPVIAHQNAIMKRMEDLEKRIAAYAYSETPIPLPVQRALQQEMRALANAFRRPGEYESTPWNTRFPTSFNREEGTYDRSYYKDTEEDLKQFNEYSGYGNQMESRNQRPTRGTRSSWTTWGSTENSDAEIRPGFVMSDDQIRYRGSTSAFDDSLVGGPDYKQRSLDLCRQIQSASIVSDPKVLGCIDQPDSVGPTYSWKGNYEMVCNRLGDTWGSWYPEMFGCPKHDPQARYKGNMM